MLNIPQSIRTGVSFGLTSSIITTLGLMIGLYFGTQSRLAVIGGIITIALADAMSDSLGIHISEESRSSITKKEVWESTITTFVIKFLFTLLFLVPVIFLHLSTALIVSIVAGYLVLSLLTYLNGAQAKNRLNMVLEHVLIMTLVIILSYFVGMFVNHYFA